MAFSSVDNTFFGGEVRLTSECDSLGQQDFCGHRFLGDFRQWGLICLIILANRVIYWQTRPNNQKICHRRPFQPTKTASNDGQVFLNLCTVHLFLLSLSCPFSSRPRNTPMFYRRTPTPFLDQKEHVSYALWKICEGDVAISWRQRAMEAMVALSTLPLLSFFAC